MNDLAVPRTCANNRQGAPEVTDRAERIRTPPQITTDQKVIREARDSFLRYALNANRVLARET
jgi:hypothetical protein